VTESVKQESVLDAEWGFSGEHVVATAVDATVEIVADKNYPRSVSDAFLLQDLLSDGFDSFARLSDVETTPEYRMSQVLKFVDSFNTGRVKGIKMSAPDLFWPEVILRDPNLGTHQGDWEAITDYWEEVFEAYDNHFLKVVEIRMESANVVSTEWSLSARQIRTSFGIPASYKTATINGTGKYTFRGGKMCEVEWTWSGIALIQQLMGLAGGMVVGVVSGMWQGVRNIAARVVSGGDSLCSNASEDTLSPGLSATSEGQEAGEGTSLAIMPSADSQQALQNIEHTIADARAAEPWYMCGYCGVRKPSTSAGGDGRVRIRCECGGKHQDRKSRMHANWRRCPGETYAQQTRMVYQNL